MSVKIVIQRPVDCPNCSGSGLVWPSLKAERSGDDSLRVCCSVCDGSGDIYESEQISLAEFRQLMAELEDED